jgi:hypothetical protein
MGFPHLKHLKVTRHCTLHAWHRKKKKHE